MSNPSIIDLTDIAWVWKKAITLVSEGHLDEATMYFKLHAKLLLSESATAMESQSDASTVKRSITNLETSPHPAASLDVVITEGGLSFIPGAITSHTDVGFTPYFDRNLKELKGPLPLTIFNKNWQDLANSYHVEKRVKTDNLNKDITTYTGYPYPHEMTQTYAAWNVSFRNFVSLLRDVYNFKTFAKWAEAHQANVEFYHERDNWMTAFRYVLRVCFVFLINVHVFTGFS